MGKILQMLGLGALGAVFAGVGIAIIGIFAIFLFAIFGALMGAITGFILQMVPVLGPLVKEGFGMIGIKDVSLPAIGAMLGFVAGFFKGGMQGKCCQ